MELGIITQTASPKSMRGKRVEIIKHDNKGCRVRLVGGTKEMKAPLNLIIPDSPELKAKWEALSEEKIQKTLDKAKDAAPHWAQEIVNRANKELPVKINGVIWKNTNGSCGGTAVLASKIVKVKTDGDVKDSMATLLHEICHLLVNQNGLGENHDDGFYSVLFTLCEYFNMDMEYMAESEALYKQRSVKWYRRFKNGYRHPIIQGV